MSRRRRRCVHRLTIRGSVDTVCARSGHIVCTVRGGRVVKRLHRLVIVLTLLFCAANQAFAGQTTPRRASGAHAESQEPPGWSATLSKTIDLEVHGRLADVVAIYEKWVADYPKFADAHVMLAGAHEQLGRAALRSRGADAAKISASEFERAAVEYRRAVELTPPNSVGMRRDPIGGLIDLYGPAELDRPAEYERVVAEGLRRHPADPLAHAYAITILARKREPIDRAVRAARAATPNSAAGRTELASALMARVLDDRMDVAMPVAAAALTLVDEALTLNPNDITALQQKAEILRAQARRASDPERMTLFAEEARVRASIAELHRVDRSDRVSAATGATRAELSAVGGLRAVLSAEFTYVSSCGGGGYAISLEDLARPDRGGGQGFIASDLSTNGAIVNGYRITLAKNAGKGVKDVSASSATCNGSKGNPASSFFATAEPVDPASGDRFFATDDRGIIFFSAKPIPNPIIESPTVVRYQ